MSAVMEGRKAKARAGAKPDPVLPAVAATEPAQPAFPLDTLDFVSLRLDHAHAILTMVFVLFSEYSEDAQGMGEDMFNSLVHAKRLVVECIEHYDALPDSLSAAKACDWYDLMREARSLLSVKEAILWADGFAVHQGESITMSYLFAVQNAIERARDMVDAAPRARVAAETARA